MSNLPGVIIEAAFGSLVIDWITVAEACALFMHMNMAVHGVKIPATKQLMVGI